MRMAPLDQGAQTILRALDQRLRTAARVLLDDEVPSALAPGHLAAELLPRLLVSIGNRPGPEAWLVLAAIKGAFPLADEVEQLARRLQLHDADTVAFELLGRQHADPSSLHAHLAMDLVIDGVVVDVDFCARHMTNTGIQRVTRSTLPLWDAKHPLTPVAHTGRQLGFRTISRTERGRVFEFGSTRAEELEEGEPFEARFIVPWRSTVVFPEVPHVHAQRRLACMAKYSGNVVGAIGYDMIPILSGHLRPVGEGGHFAQYLALIKYAHRVAGISNSATAEFDGFKRMLTAQGLDGPDVAEVELAEDVPHDGGRREVPDRPLVVIPGRRELHKNVRACVQAAHRLWVEGLEFDVVTLGGAGWAEDGLTATVQKLKNEGYPLTTLGWVSDEDMWRHIRNASFVVFASQHEGYGLPISESLMLGTPVVTADFGSQREIAERGGCLLVDPRSDSAIADAMRTLITQPEVLEGLRGEITGRPRRSWVDYADELWDFLVDGKEAHK